MANKQSYGVIKPGFLEGYEDPTGVTSTLDRYTPSTQTGTGLTIPGITKNAGVGYVPPNPTTKNSWVGSDRMMTDLQAGGQLGLGIASFLDSRKTAGLQRDMMRENLQMARDDQALRKARTDGWAKAFSSKE